VNRRFLFAVAALAVSCLPLSARKNVVACVPNWIELYPQANQQDQVGETLWHNRIPTLWANADFGRSAGLGGIMIWSLDQGVSGEKSLLTAVHEGLVAAPK